MASEAGSWPIKIVNCKRFLWPAPSKYLPVTFIPSWFGVERKQADRSTDKIRTLTQSNPFSGHGMHINYHSFLAVLGKTQTTDTVWELGVAEISILLMIADGEPQDARARSMQYLHNLC